MGGTSVLIVDDDPGICAELELFLSKNGYEVMKASNGKDAFSVYKKMKPDMIITDYRMPAMNGFELLLNIRRADKKAKVILMSAVVDLDPFVLTRDSAAYEFIEKPLDLTRLLELMKKI